MNDVKICVSVIADTAADLIELMRRAEPEADVIELRLDGVDHEDLRSALQSIHSTKQLLLTMRPKEQGGRSCLDRSGRISFWKEYAHHQVSGQENVWIDLEYDLIDEESITNRLNEHLIVRSRHFLTGEKQELSEAYDTVVSTIEVGKVAAAAEDVTDTIGLWNLMERARQEEKRLIPIAMGEAGKLTRILGPAHGAFMTYASLETGGETAAGQISAADLIHAFRVRELDLQTTVYGILAADTSHSHSPWMHNAAFKAAGLNSVFVPLQSADVETFLTRMVRPESREIDINFGGFAVTLPYKEVIIPFLDEVDKTARQIEAVNTIIVDNGRLLGLNTDAFGFISTLEKEAGVLKGLRAAVFGAGGAARACVYSLCDAGADVTVFARDESKAKSLADDFGARCETWPDQRRMADDFDILVNATPLGTVGPKSEFSVLTAPQLEGLKLVYDLVSNPSETRLMAEARAAGVPSVGGIEMLIAQGVRQFEIWTGLEAPAAEMRSAVVKRIGA